MRISKEKSTDAQTALIGSALASGAHLPVDGEPLHIAANRRNLICDNPNSTAVYMNVFYPGTPTSIQGLTAHMMGGQPVLMNSEALLYVDPRSLRFEGSSHALPSDANADPVSQDANADPVSQYSSIDILRTTGMAKALNTRYPGRSRFHSASDEGFVDDILVDFTQVEGQDLASQIRSLQNRQEQITAFLLEAESHSATHNLSDLESEYNENQRVLGALAANAPGAAPSRRTPFAGLYDNDVFDNTQTQELKNRLKNKNAQELDSLQADLVNVKNQLRSLGTTLLPAAKRKRNALKGRKRTIVARMTVLREEFM